MLHVCRYPGCSSLLRPNPAILNLFTGIGAEPDVGNYAVISEEPIETVRLADCDVPPPDYMKLDIQGWELEALEGAEGRLDALCVAESEALFVALYEDQPLFGDIQRWFADRGFMLHKMIDLASRPYRPIRVGANAAAPFSQWLWADAIFVRDPSDLSRWPTNGLVKAALVLHALYASYDLALVLLNEHDRREGGGLGRSYAQALAAAPRLDPQLVTIRTAP